MKTKELSGNGRKLLRLIAGSGRSGTTWVLDVLAEANALRPVFEPLHTDTSEVGQKYGYAYLTREFKCPELEALFSPAARGALNTIWTDYRIKPDRLTPGSRHFRSRTELKALAHRWMELASRYGAYRDRKARTTTIIKCIRANLMLDWIHANFDARILLLMRHPGAAIESRLRFAEHWDPFPLLEQYRNDPGLMSGPLSAHSASLGHRLTRTEALAAIWCIENLIPASQAAPNGYVVAFYEELLESPDTEWQRVAVGLELDRVPAEHLLRRPSQQSAAQLKQAEVPAEDYPKVYGGWLNRVSHEDLAQIDSMLQAFDVQFYDVSEERPRVEVFAQRFLARDNSSPNKGAELLARP